MRHTVSTKTRRRGPFARNRRGIAAAIGATSVVVGVACGGGDGPSDGAKDAGAGDTDVALPDASLADVSADAADARVAIDGDVADAAAYGYVRRLPFLRGRGTARGAVLLEEGTRQTAVVAGFSGDGWLGEYPVDAPDSFTWRTLERSRFKSILRTKAGGLALSGATREGDAGTEPSFPFAMLMDDKRNVLWKKHLGRGLGTGSAYGMAEASNGDFLVVGSASVGSPNGFDVRVTRLKPDGTAIWEQTYGGSAAGDAGKGLTPGTEKPVSILALADGGAVVVGSTNATFGSGNEDVWAFRISESGSIAWQVAYGGPKADVAFGASLAPDGKKVWITGSTTSFGKGSGDAWLVAVDTTTGFISSQATFGSADRAEHARSVAFPADGGMLVVGTDPEGMLVLRLDADLAVVWQRKYRNAAALDGWAYGVQALETADHGFAYLAGGFERAWLVKSAADGTLGGCKLGGFGTELVSTTFVTTTSNAIAVPTSVAPVPRTPIVSDLRVELRDATSTLSDACR